MKTVNKIIWCITGLGMLYLFYMTIQTNTPVDEFVLFLYNIVFAKIYFRPKTYSTK